MKKSFQQLTHETKMKIINEKWKKQGGYVCHDGKKGVIFLGNHGTCLWCFDDNTKFTDQDLEQITNEPIHKLVEKYDYHAALIVENIDDEKGRGEYL